MSQSNKKNNIKAEDILTQLEKVELRTLFELVKPRTDQEIGVAAAERQRSSELRKNTGSMIKHGLQNTKDEYARTNIVPALTNTNLYNKFGTLSLDQQREMERNAQATANKLYSKTTNWTQYFYNTILNSKVVKLSTFVNNFGVAASESFYTNYKVIDNKLLFEDIANVSAYNKERDVIFLNSSSETRAYIRAARVPGLFIGAATSGKYMDFTYLKSNMQTEEALKLKSFAASIVESVKTNVVSMLEPYFRTPTEKVFLNNFKTGQLSPVFLDSLMFALVDTLNLPLGRNYGFSRQALTQLLGNPFISNDMLYGNSLFQSNPQAAAAISQELNKCKELVNPYIINIDKLIGAISKSFSKSNFPSALANVMFGNFGTLLANLNKACGIENFDFNTIFSLSSSGEKKAALIKAVHNRQIFSSFNNKNKVPNPFIQLIFTRRTTRLSRKSYVIQPVNVSGIYFDITQESVQSNTQSYSNTDIWRSIILPEYQHAHILDLAKQEHNGDISNASYITELAKLDTREDTAQNAAMGETVSSETILLDLLDSLYNGDGTFKPDTVIFAIIPRLLFECANQEIYSYWEETLEHNSLYAMSKSTDPTSIQQVGALISRLVPVSKLRDTFLNVMYNLSTTKEEIKVLKHKFSNLAINISRGYWASDKLQERNILGLVNVLHSISGDVGLNSTLIDDQAELIKARNELLNRNLRKRTKI